jgi:tetratricopeptide (TPR) repeat protein
MVGACRQNTTFSDRNEEDLFFKLLHKRDYKRAGKMVDSLMEINKTKGMYYFQKGMIESQLENFHESIPFFKKSYQLNYWKDDCLRMIKFNTSADSLKNAYKNDVHRDDRIQVKK